MTREFIDAYSSAYCILLPRSNGTHVLDEVFDERLDWQPTGKSPSMLNGSKFIALCSLLLVGGLGYFNN